MLVDDKRRLIKIHKSELKSQGLYRCAMLLQMRPQVHEDLHEDEQHEAGGPRPEGDNQERPDDEREVHQHNASVGQAHQF